MNIREAYEAMRRLAPNRYFSIEVRLEYRPELDEACLEATIFDPLTSERYKAQTLALAVQRIQDQRQEMFHVEHCDKQELEAGDMTPEQFAVPVCEDVPF